MGIVTDGAAAMPTFLALFDGCESFWNKWLVLKFTEWPPLIALTIAKRFALDTYSNMTVELNANDITVSNLRADSICRY